MKTLNIEIKTHHQANEEFIETFKAIKAGKKVTPKKGTYFSSLEAVRNLLTEKRLELLELIRTQKPFSITTLANLAGRDFKNVHQDLKVLKEYGLVQFSRPKKVTRGSPRVISAPYQEINIHAWL